MDWYQVGAFIGVNVALFGALATLIIWVVNKLDGDVKSINADVKSCMNRLDGHAARIDQLYQMFIQLVKDGRK